jgi:uncharacterized protein YcfJ
MRPGSYRTRAVLGLGLTATIALSACGPAATPQQQAQRQHEIACMTGTVGGALIGGAIGNQFGGGTGRDIMTGAGAATGALAGSNYAC